MFDLGWTELLLIGIVALIVVGPKDLPILFRRAGQFVGRLRAMAREFSSAMNDAADDAGVRDVASHLRAAANPVQTGLDSIKGATSDFLNYDPDTETGRLAEQRAEQTQKLREEAQKRSVQKNKKSNLDPSDNDFDNNPSVTQENNAVKTDDIPKKDSV